MLPEIPSYRDSKFSPGQRLLVPFQEGDAPRAARVAYAFPAGLLLVDDDGRAAFVSRSRVESSACLAEDGNSQTVPSLK